MYKPPIGLESRNMLAALVLTLLIDPFLRCRTPRDTSSRSSRLVAGNGISMS